MPKKAEKGEDLPAAAVSSVKDAIDRGLARRARRDRNLGRAGSSANASSSADIIIGSSRGGGPSTPKPGSLRAPDSLINGGDSESDDESNDEWEEQVDVDTRAAEVAVRKARRAAAKRSREDRAKAEQDAVKQRRTEEENARPTPEQLAEAAKKAAKQHTARERSKCAQLFDAHLTLLLGELLRMDKAANSTELQAIALSTVPPDVLPSDARAPREALARLALWARTAFRPATLFPSPTRRIRPASQMLRALRALNVHSAHVFDIAVALVAALRADGTRARVVVPLRPYQFLPKPFPASLVKKNEKKKGSKKSSSSTGDKPVVVSGEMARKMKANKVVEQLAEHGANLYAWLEVWCATEQVWLSLDFVAGFIDVAKKKMVVENMRAHALELLQRSKTYEEDAARLRNASSSTSRKQALSAMKEMVEIINTDWLARIVAVENGVLTDVTRRYLSKWKIVQKERGKSRPLEKFIEELSKASDKDDVAVKAENKLFDEIACKDDLPTTIAGLHKHPRYVLERHLKKYETVHPLEPVGHLKEEPIYLRSHVHLLHSKERWMRQMRHVRDDEQPLKYVKSMMRDSDVKTPLFGEWQTDRLVIQPVVDGKVPRNTRGNVELWTPEHLPAGGTHVNLKYAASAARALSIDYAEAMTGFDIRGGRSVPRIEGAVVASEFAEAVSAAALEKERQAQERAKEKALEEACNRWKALLKNMHAREKVRRKYGGLFDDDSTYLQQEKRKGEMRARAEKQAELTARASSARSSGAGPSSAGAGPSGASAGGTVAATSAGQKRESQSRGT